MSLSDHRIENVLITGAGFGNKGAQAMLFVTASEIKARYPETTIYYATRDRLVDRKGFKLYALDKHTLANAFGIKTGDVNRIGGFLEATKQVAISLLKKNSNAFYSEYRYLKLVEKFDLILDISGYNLTSLFAIKTNDYYLKFIDYARKCGIPIFLMPQSFGPLDYPQNHSPYLSRMSEILQYPNLIFARETTGYDLLTKQLGLRNVVLSTDLVLQSREINWYSIFEPGNIPTVDITITTNRNTAIIPNQKVLDNCPHIDIYQLYREIIGELLRRKRTVYLICHSSEDNRICRKIKAEFATVESVILFQQELNCYDYEKLITRFDYVIASRYHSIVHAFKRNIPCLGLGWAEKYQELFSALAQQNHLLDMRNKVHTSEIMERLETLEQNWQSERQVIKEQLETIQRNNCFDRVFDELAKQGI